MRSAEPPGPIADSELPRLFETAGDAAAIALAVSGGCDSLALLDCAARWRDSRRGAPRLHVFTVDHGLRASSGAEAETVAEIARGRGLEAKVLRWTGAKPRSDVEAAAREARYRLLLAATREAGASHLFLAHHCDDQAETLLLRLARGSGLFGLSGMRREIVAGDVTIVRPFLDIRRSRLQETVALAKLVPVEDEMNTDPRFARARIRRIMPLLAANGIDPAGLAATARRLVSSAEAIDQGATHLVAEAVVIDDLASAHLDADRFFSSASEVSNRALVRLLLAIGGDLFPPRFERLCALADDMRSHVAPARFKRTLSGCIVEYRRGGFLIYRETGRAGLPEIRIAPGFEGIWDHRFVVKIGDGAPQGLDLGALGPDGRREAGLRSDIAPPGVLEALPALKRNGRLLAAPGYRLDGCRWAEIQPIVARRAAEPPIFPDFLSGGASGAFTLP